MLLHSMLDSCCLLFFSLAVVFNANPHQAPWSCVHSWLTELIQFSSSQLSFCTIISSSEEQESSS
ncbi:hypothetical protein M758_UG210700 [Ceratodon purpureus]|nr:hypothetical protein M758_UG210700 [Ceratodon purpureus]